MTAKRANLSKPTSSPRRALAPPLATAELLKDMYARMLRARSLADTNPVTILEQRPTSSEAVTVGVGVELKAGDTLSADRHHLIEYLSSIAEGSDEHARWLKSARGMATPDCPLACLAEAQESFRQTPKAGRKSPSLSARRTASARLDKPMSR